MTSAWDQPTRRSPASEPPETRLPGPPRRPAAAVLTEPGAPAGPAHDDPARLDPERRDPEQRDPALVELAERIRALQALAASPSPGVRSQPGEAAAALGAEPGRTAPVDFRAPDPADFVPDPAGARPPAGPPDGPPPPSPPAGAAAQAAGAAGLSQLRANQGLAGHEETRGNGQAAESAPAPPDYYASRGYVPRDEPAPDRTPASRGRPGAYGDGQGYRSGQDRRAMDGRSGQADAAGWPQDRPARGSLAELRLRLERLPAGHPSSPYDDQGALKSSPQQLRQLELPLADEDSDSPARARTPLSAPGHDPGPGSTELNGSNGHSGTAGPTGAGGFNGSTGLSETAGPNGRPGRPSVAGGGPEPSRNGSGPAPASAPGGTAGANGAAYPDLDDVLTRSGSTTSGSLADSADLLATHAAPRDRSAGSRPAPGGSAPGRPAGDGAAREPAGDIGGPGRDGAAAGDPARPGGMPPYRPASLQGADAPFGAGAPYDTKPGYGTGAPAESQVPAEARARAEMGAGREAPAPHEAEGRHQAPAGPNGAPAPNGRAGQTRELPAREAPGGAAVADRVLSGRVLSAHEVSNRPLLSNGLAETRPAGAADVVLPELTPDQEQIADRVLGQYRAAVGRNVFGGYSASGLTPALRRVEVQLPHGRLLPEDDELALKSPERFKAKLAKMIARSPGVPPEELAAEIYDAARYSFVFEPQDYTDSTWLVHRRLKAQGFELEARRNRWESPEYKGIRTRWRDPTHDLAFEVQFHTPASWDVLQRTFDAYLRITDPRLPAAERAQLRAGQVAASTATRPPARSAEIADFRAEAR